MFVSAILLRHIAKEVESLGVELSHLLAGTGIDADELENYGAIIPLTKVDVFVRRAMALTDPGLGLVVAVNSPPTTPSFVAQLVSVCKNLREAFTVIQGFADCLVKGSSWTLQEDSGVARCVYHGPVWLGDTSRFAADLSIAFSHKLAQRFLPHDHDRPIKVTFRHERPAYAQRYRAVFDCPVEFDGPETSISFGSEYLDRPYIMSDPLLKKAFQEAASRVLYPRTYCSVAEDLRVLLRVHPELSTEDAEGLARRIGLSARSMRRKLKLEGLSLTDVVSDVRREIACQSLRDPSTNIQKTAEQAGFMERSAFHRAFKRWTGETPVSYRKRMST